MDLVEGVCVQTRESIKKAFEEHTKMILVLNKFDRLVVELKKNIDEIFQTVLRVIEGCNAIVAELYQYEFTDNEVDIEDTGLLFSPDTGNVIFASAIDGWGFTTRQIARMFVGFVQNETVDSLDKKLWDFDCYIDSKKEIKTGAIDKKKTNLFTQFCLKTVIHIYETILIRMEKDKVQLILEKLKLSNITRDMTHNDPKIQIRAILQAWKPLSTTILLQCLKVVPPPSKIDKTKIEYLLNINRYCEDPYLGKCVEDIMPYFQKITTESTTPTVAYISKMFCVSKKNLSQNKPKTFIPKPREEFLREKLENASAIAASQQENVEADTAYTDDIAVIALARVFTGALTVGQEIYVITGNYLPDEEKISQDPENFINSNKYICKVTIKQLYMLFGRELMLVDYIPAGNFCGIGGLEAEVLRTATLSSILNMVPLTEKLSTNPVVRHAVEPVNPKELPILRNGLKLLMQSDSCVEVIMQETGELVLLTAGDVHLGKCIEDLTTKFAKVEIHVSRPMVSLRETIISSNPDNNYLRNTSNDIVVNTPQFSLSVVALPLPEVIVDVIKANHELFTTVEEHQYKSFVDIARQSFEQTQEVQTPSEKVFRSEVTKKNLIHVKGHLKSVCQPLDTYWTGIEEKIWSVGKNPDCINLLINYTDDYLRNIYYEINCHDQRALFDHCILKAFNILCKAGPLCEEPLTNCGFVINKFELVKEVNPEDITPQTTSAIESALRGTFKKALEKQDQRLMEPMYVTDIQVNTNILGELFVLLVS